MGVLDGFKNPRLGRQISVSYTGGPIPADSWKGGQQRDKCLGNLDAKFWAVQGVEPFSRRSQS